jgi:hypothetical protein
MSVDHPCPACGEVVDATEALDRGACPSCDTDLSTLFDLAQSRRFEA